MRHAVSVRLDLEALGALKVLEATGLTRSEAIRSAILAAHDRLSQPANLAVEAERLRHDADDRDAVAALRSDMDADGDPWLDLEP